MKALIDIVKGRKSVRTFDGIGINEEDRKDIENYITGITNPFDVHVEFILLDADKHGLSSPVLSGERLYVAGKVEKTEYAAVAYGYSFEKLCLHAWDKGIGTVLIGGKDVPVEGVIDNFDKYDTVYVGFPIWYGQAPRVIHTFAQGYDWAGKTVHAFATSGGSGIGKTAEKLSPSLKNAASLDAKLVHNQMEL